VVIYSIVDLEFLTKGTSFRQVRYNQAHDWVADVCF